MIFTFPAKLLAVALTLTFASSSFGTVFAENPIAGWRSSQYGDIYQWGHDQSDPAYWISVAQQMSSKFPGFTPGGVLVVGEINGSSGTATSTFLPFPKPVGTYPNVVFGTTDTIEPLLDAYDNAGLKVYLQVESADADVSMLMDLIMDRYKNHPSVIGFGVDAEWYHEAQYPGWGRPLTDSEVNTWAAQVKTFDPDYQLMIKHWDPSYLSNARPNNVLFLTDPENIGSLSNTINKYIAWIDNFGNSKVGFQIGYPSDISWWSILQDPASSIMNPVIAARPNANIDAIFWVDFSVLVPFPSSSITINDVTKLEGNSGTNDFIFTVTRSANTSEISIQYQTADNTAKSPSDYTSLLPATLDFPFGGPLTQTITVSVKNDFEVEPDETFNVNLSNCIGGCVILDAQGVGTIKNDDLPGPSILSFGSFGSAHGQFRTPLDVTIDSAARIIVADSKNNRIQIFSPDGTYLSQFGSQGTGNGKFLDPYDIAVDSADRIIVADTGNNQIQIFSPDGTYLSQFGSLGPGNGKFNGPVGLAVDSVDRIIVADSNNHRIQTFSSDGTYLSQFGSPGAGNGQFSFPSGIAVDSADRIIVADSNNHRIQIFSPDGTYLSQFGSQGTGNAQFSNPSDIGVDSTDRIIIADTFNDRIQIFESTGIHVEGLGSSGLPDGEFNDPSGVEVDSTDRIIIADTFNNRIQTFHGPPPLDLDSDGIPNTLDNENIIVSSGTLSNSHLVLGNVIIQNGAVLTIPNGQSLTIPSGSNITVESGGGILIKSGGILQINS